MAATIFTWNDTVIYGFQLALTMIIYIPSRLAKPADIVFWPKYAAGG